MMRLWVRLALVMGLLATGPLLLLGGDAIRTASRGAESASEARLAREARAQAELVGRWLTDQRRALETWPPQFGNRLQGFSPQEQAGFARLVFNGTPAALAVALVDGDGAPLVAPVRDPRGRVDPDLVSELLARVPLDRARASPGRAVMGLPWGEGRAARLPLAVVAASRPREILLAVAIELEVAADLEAQASSERGVALVDPSGRVVVGAAHPLIPGELLRSLLGAAPRIDFDVPGEPPVRGRIEGVPGSAPDAEQPGWSLVVAESADALLQSARAVRQRLAISVLLAVALAVGMALWLARTVSEPVASLRDVALAVAEGALGRRSGVTRHDEIGDLARAFDHMSSSLAHSQREIEAQQSRIEGFNEELQEEVAARTAELEAAQAELVRSGQLAAVAELGAGLAHDLNNPLTSVLGIAQVLRSTEPNNTLFRDLESEAARCREVVNTMLRVAELQVDPEQAPVVDLTDVLRRVSELVDGSFRQRGVELRLVTEAEPGELRVRAEPTSCARLLTQVLAGLRAGLDRGTRVDVSAHREAQDVVVELRASESVAGRLERRDDLRTAGRSLWVARQLAASMGGSLEDGPDGGWRLVLPGG